MSCINNRWVKVTAGMAAAIALVLLLLPFGVKYYLIKWLEEKGADRAVIQKLRYNPFAGSVTVGGVDVQVADRTRLHHSTLALNFGLTSLFKRDFRLQRMDYRDLAIDIEQYGDGERILNLISR